MVSEGLQAGVKELRQLGRSPKEIARSLGLAPSLIVPIVQALVRGAVVYARGLGFEPHRDFRRAARLLDPLEEPCAITFGHDGEPNYVQGPYDDARLVLETLERSVGAGNFHFTVSAADIAGEPGYEDMDMLIEA